jgi:hypothetical protein
VVAGLGYGAGAGNALVSAMIEHAITLEVVPAGRGDGLSMVSRGPVVLDEDCAGEI